MSERFNPYDLNDVAKVDKIVEKKREESSRSPRNLIHLPPGVEFNPYDLEHVAMIAHPKPRS